MRASSEDYFRERIFAMSLSIVYGKARSDIPRKACARAGRRERRDEDYFFEREFRGRFFFAERASLEARGMRLIAISRRRAVIESGCGSE
jgi:hypothetical protein